MKQLKKLPLMGLLVMLLIGVFALPVSADDLSGQCGKTVNYSLDMETGTLTISGTGAMYDYGFASEIELPWKGYISSIKAVVIGDNITHIGSSAFKGCTGLTSIDIPSGVTSIGSDAFAGCTGLTEIKSFGGITSISGNTFFGCTGLTSIKIPDKITSIEAGAFYCCSSLKSVEIPSSVTNIGFNGFSGEMTFYGDDPSEAKTYAQKESIAFKIRATGVILDKETISLEVGNTATLTPTVAPVTVEDKSVVWSSSDETVAKVANGLVTAAGNGIATITVTTNNCQKTAVCTVIVGAGSVTGVTLNKEATSLNVGATETLTATVAPDNATNKAVTWTSDNTKAATVDNNGKVTGVAPGIAIITVTTADGGKTAACKVKVTGPVEEFTDVASDAWFAPYVNDLVSLGIINGKGNGIFDPQGKITRAEFAKILATASGDDLTQYKDKTSFTDVATGQWFSESIEWAYQKGIVQGKGDGLYSPNDSISRQDMAVMIIRYAGYKIITLPETKPAVTFADEAEIGSWAKDAVAVMQKAGIIEGKGDNKFAPRDNATRAEAAKMISVFLNM